MKKVSRREMKNDAARRRRENAIMYPSPPSPPVPGSGSMTAEQIDQHHQKKMSRSFTAKYTGACSSCFDEIHPGQRVRFTPEGLVHHRHDAPVRVERVCPTCHLVKPCGCDE